MDILQYLLALLKTHKQIGIEGLGTFYKKKTPGRYDAESHSFLPPSYALEFTSELLENTALYEYIQNKRGISTESAKYFIGQFVDEVQKSLENGSYELENLGTLQKEDTALVFIPGQNIDTGFDFFALPSVTAAIVSPSEEVSAPAPTNVQAQIEQVQVPEFEQEIAKLELTATEIDPENENTHVEEQPKEEPIAEPQEEQPLGEENPVAPNSEEDEEVNNVEEINAANEAASISTPDQETTEPQVVEEMGDKHFESTEKQTEQWPEDNDQDTWSFEEESVVAAQDLSAEDNFTKTEADVTEDQNSKDFKLNATTHDWNFDTIESKAEESVHINFDRDAIEGQESAEESKMPFYQKLLIGLLVIIVALAILYLVKPNLFDNFKKDTTNPNEKMVVPIQRSNLKTQQDSISFADSIMKNAEKVGLAVEKAKDTLAVTTTKKQVPLTYTYDIIIASFATEKKAQAYISRMKKKGFDAKISTMHGKRKNISIATYNNIDSAQKYVIKFRKQFDNQDIYAQPIKNK